MNFKGKIQEVLQPRTGVTKAGKEWKVTEFVVRNDEGKYPESYLFSLFNKDIDALVGDEVEVRFEGNAREYNGRWYNDLKAYDVIKLTPLAQVPRAQMPSQPVPPQPQIFDQQILEEKNDELPF